MRSGTLRPSQPPPVAPGPDQLAEPTGQGSGGGTDYLFISIYLNNRHSFLSSGVGESMTKTLADPVSGESPFLVHREPSLPVLIW